MTKNQKLRRWELALLLGVGLAAVLGVWLSGEQQALADQVVRLHVIANSDSAEDQALKLAVRDSILADTAGLFAGESREDALGILADSLDEIAAIGARRVGAEGYHYPVTVSLEECWFPTKEYEDFSLPAGSYTALRVVLGEGGGQNWWCVVFPPLCLGAVTEEATQETWGDYFSGEELALITGENQGYVVKFKLMEWWENLKNRFS